MRRDSKYQLEEVLDWAAHLEYLQAMLKEFDPIYAPNKTTLICYLWEGLCLSIWVQLDHWGRDLDLWEEVVEKAGDAEAKANLQPPSYVWEIDVRSPKNYRLSSKKNKENIQRQHHNEAPKNKGKSQIPATTNQLQTQDSKKRHEGQWGNRPATEVNATKVVKKEKDKAKDLSHVKCYTCNQKDHYANKYPDKPKK